MKPYSRKIGRNPKDMPGGLTFMRISENNLADKEPIEHGLLEQILDRSNLNRAYQKVVRNRGAGGVDKMSVDSLREYLSEKKHELIASIYEGRYRPNPVRRVEIEKENGGKRQLGIPTVVDRVVQQAVTQILSPIYEKQFSEFSYGFRPNRSAHQALRQCQSYMASGYRYAVDMDLEKFFDKVNHSKLIEVLGRTIKDSRVISLIHRYLNAGVVANGVFEKSTLGVPQGGPLSPLLSNIMLNELDKELERRGHKFVRYADDMIILCKSKRSAERTFKNILPFIEEKLFLKVNREKSQVAYIGKVKFLGYSFYQSRESHLRVHPKSMMRMKARIKELTSKSNGFSDARRKMALRRFITGWVQYFKLANMKKLLKEIDEWYRRRLRMVIWKQWKRVKTRGRNLMKLGVDREKAWRWANTRKGYWRISKSPILSTTITNEKLKAAGYISLFEYYQSVR